MAAALVLGGAALACSESDKNSRKLALGLERLKYLCVVLGGGAQPQE